MKTLFNCIHGSHLYGLNTETSDKDYKGIFLPSFEDCCLLRVKQSQRNSTNNDNSKNTLEDIDNEFWALQKFLDLCQTAQMPALDMLFTKPEHWFSTSDTWEFIYNNRVKLLSKRFDGFLGYIERQVSKYGVKGSRVDAVRKLLAVVGKADPKAKLLEVWDLIPTNNEFIHLDFTYTIPQLVVCNRKLQATVLCGYAKDLLEKLLSNYGERALKAEQNEGVDWKAVSHAFRCAYVVSGVCENPTDFYYPFEGETKEFLLKLKLGQFHFVKDSIAEQLQLVVDDCRDKLVSSQIPNQVDVEFWNNFIVETYLNK